MTAFAKSSANILFTSAVFIGASFSPVLALQPMSPASPMAPEQDPAVSQIASKCGLKDGAYTGPVTDAYYGPLQVQANVQGGCVVSVDVLQYPRDRSTSRRINDQALPILQSEVISAQSGRISAVSGATLTSRAYIRSLGTALGQAGAK